MADYRYDPYSRLFVPMAKVIPPGERKTASVEHFTVSKEDSGFTALRAMCGHHDEYVEPGRYCRLKVNGGVMMSDTDMEKRSNIDIVREAARAGGHVLIAGLGLGMIVVPIARAPEVKSVTVVEINPDVVDLVEPHLRAFLRKTKDSKKLRMCTCDIFDWKMPRGKKWDTIYFDIWTNICTDNLEGLTKLKRKFARRLNRENEWAEMRGWKEDYLRYRRQQEYQSRWW